MAKTYWLLWNDSFEFDDVDSIDKTRVMYCILHEYYEYDKISIHIYFYDNTKFWVM